MFIVTRIDNFLKPENIKSYAISTQILLNLKF